MYYILSTFFNIIRNWLVSLMVKNKGQSAWNVVIVYWVYCSIISSLAPGFYYLLQTTWLPVDTGLSFKY